LKREFTEKERDDFLDASFEYIANYFEESLRELQERNPGIESGYKRVDRNHFTASVYSGGKKRSSCRIGISSMLGRTQGIAYSSSDTAGDSSFNEMLSVHDDGFTLGLSTMGIWSRGERDSMQTQQGAAEMLWSELIEPLQQ
jgi:hypothetical protein